MSYPVAANEAQRLAGLRNLHILDTAAELPFDTLTAIARQHFATPIVAISLVEEQRQWFKSHPGLGVCETHRDVAFCNYTIMSDAVFEVTDAATDPTFQANPLVTADPHIRYYCGAPILVRGHRLGAFCVIDRVARPAMSDGERQVLQGLAFLTVHILATHRELRESASALVALLR
jgi:GAF domain-containing protein